MPRFSEYFDLGKTQHELDFVDVSNDFDTPVYVDPFAIEIKEDIWARSGSGYIRNFFKQVLISLRMGDFGRASELMDHLREPKETYLGVSFARPQGRGVGRGQARLLISAIQSSPAFKTGLLTDLSEMSLYVEGVDRDKISDLTTNIIRKLLVDYTLDQCNLYGVPTGQYASPPMWNNELDRWESAYVSLPYIEDDPVLLVPKYIVRRKLSMDSQEFYNKQITDYLVAEHKKAQTSLVKVVRGREVVYKGDVRAKDPKSKSFIADMVVKHPELLDMFKEIARKHPSLVRFDDDESVPSVQTICQRLSVALSEIPSGAKDASVYHNVIMGALTALFYPDWTVPSKEHEINQGRKRIDIAYVNAAESGFFAHRRSDASKANIIMVECKNYSVDVANPEIDQILGRFDNNRGRFGIITCRSVEDNNALLGRCQDAATSGQGIVIVLTDDDVIRMLDAKANLNDAVIQKMLNEKYMAVVS